FGRRRRCFGGSLGRGFRRGADREGLTKFDEPPLLVSRKIRVRFDALEKRRVAQKASLVDDHQFGERFGEAPGLLRDRFVGSARVLKAGLEETRFLANFEAPGENADRGVPRSYQGE